MPLAYHGLNSDNRETRCTTQVREYLSDYDDASCRAENHPRRAFLQPPRADIPTPVVTHCRRRDRPFRTGIVYINHCRVKQENASNKSDNLSSKSRAGGAAKVTGEEWPEKFNNAK